MKNLSKLMLFIATVAITISACKKPEESVLKIKFTSETFEVTTAAADPISSGGQLKNLTDEDLEIKWETSEVSSPSTAWDVQTCDADGCVTATSGTFTLKANETTTLAAQFTSTEAGTASARITAYVVGIEDKKVSSTHKATSTYVAQTVKIEFTGDATTTGMAGGAPLSTTGKIKNLTATTLDIAWEVTEKTVPSNDWKIQICDPLLCYAETITSGTFTLNPNEESTFKTQFRMTTAGNGTAKLSAWVVGEQADAISRIHSCTAN